MASSATFQALHYSLLCVLVYFTHCIASIKFVKITFFQKICFTLPSIKVERVGMKICIPQGKKLRMEKAEERERSNSHSSVK